MLKPFQPLGTTKQLAILLSLACLGGIPEPAWSKNPPLQAAVAEAPLNPPSGSPLAGFSSFRRRIIPWDIFNSYPLATFFKPAKGAIDPLRVKVLFLRRGEQRLVFVSADLVAIPENLHRDVLAKVAPLGLKKEEVFISATHTHSGPGGLSRNPIYGVLFFDRFQQPIYDELVSSIAGAIQQAAAHPKAAQLYRHRFAVEGLQRNRSNTEGTIDRMANLLLVRDVGSGAWLGGLANFAIHPTAHSARSNRFSADIPGAIERELEARLGRSQGRAAKPVVLFVNGAMGDISPQHRDAAGVSLAAHSFAAQAERTLASAQPLKGTWSVTTAQAKLGEPFFNLAGCLKHPVARALARRIRIGPGEHIPATTTVSTIALDGLAMTALPGEPTTALGQTLQANARRQGASQAWILATTNDYLGYFVTPTEFKRGQYEACSTFYGQQGGEQLAAAALKTLQGLNN